MVKSLVVYHSRTGYTRRVAQALARRLDAELEEIRIVQPMGGWPGYLMCAIEAIAGLAPALQPSAKSPAGYSLVVVGTPIWFWSLASPVRSWLEKNPLQGQRVAFFCTMGSSGANCAFSTMSKLAGAPPVATLSLSDRETDAGATGKIDSFVRALQPARRRTRPTSMNAASAVA